jgi:hypothetical protein
MEIEQQNETCIIINNVLPKDILYNFKKEVFRFPYSFQDYGTNGMSNEFFRTNNIKNIYEQFQFSSVIVNKAVDPPFYNREHYHLASLPLTLACLKLGWSYTDDMLLKLKTNIQTKAPKEYKDHYNEPHIDIDYPNIETSDIMTAIYYVNDSDGDTVLFEGEYKKTINTKPNFNNYKIIKKVTPKENKLIIFPVYRIHAGMHPIDSNRRIVMNFNFKASQLKD